MIGEGVDWIEWFSGWLWFVVPVILPGFVAFELDREVPRRGLIWAFLVTLVWGLWPVWMGDAPQVFSRHVHFWAGAFLDQPALAAAGVVCLIASAAAVVWSWAKPTAARVLASLTGMSIYWSFCFYGYGFWITHLL